MTFHRCSKVFGVDDGYVRELLASGHAALANNTLWGSSILMHKLFLYCGGTAWDVLPPPSLLPPYPMDVADEDFSKAGATRPMCLWWSVLPPCNSTDQHISGSQEHPQIKLILHLSSSPCFQVPPSKRGMCNSPRRPSVSLCGCFNWPSLW